MKTSTTSAKSVSRIRLEKVAVALFWLGVWQFASMLISQEILLVSPVKALLRFIQLAVTSGFWGSVLASCLRVAAGFLAALAVGGLLAAACARFEFFARIFSPLLRIISTTPVASFIILALVWLPKNNLPVFIVFLMVTPVVWGNLYTGILKTDRQLLEMARMFRLSRPATLRTIYVPEVMPFFTAAASTGFAFAWKSGVAAEIIALPDKSIGKNIYNAKIYLETPDLFAWTMAVILISVVLEKAMMVLLDRLAVKAMRIRLGEE